MENDAKPLEQVQRLAQQADVDAMSLILEDDRQSSDARVFRI